MKEFEVRKRLWAECTADAVKLWLYVRSQNRNKFVFRTDVMTAALRIGIRQLGRAKRELIARGYLESYRYAGQGRTQGCVFRLPGVDAEGAPEWFGSILGGSIPGGSILRGSILIGSPLIGINKNRGKVQPPGSPPCGRGDPGEVKSKTREDVFGDFPAEPGAPPEGGARPAEAVPAENGGESPQAPADGPGLDELLVILETRPPKAKPPEPGGPPSREPPPAEVVSLRGSEGGG